MTEAIVEPSVKRVGQGHKNAGQVTLDREQRKLTKAEAGFQENGGIPELRCGDCHFFTGKACRIVEGEIDADDVCNQFEPALDKGNVSSATVVASDLPHVDMYIYRVSENSQTGERRWFATASGTKIDKYQERMSVPLFKDFIQRAESREPAPKPFASKAWNGGLPYLGVAHYLDLEGAGIVGPTDRIWVDGDVFKAKGRFRDDSPLADRAFDAIRQDADKGVPKDQRVRISIAFVDWEHEHESHGIFKRKSLDHSCAMCLAGIGNKRYLKGHLVHLALTRRPAYEETDISLEERSDMTSKRDDAASIVGEEEADKLEKRQAETLAMRSDGAKIAEGAIVVKDDEGAPDDGGDAGNGGEVGEGLAADRITLGGAATLDEAEKALAERSDNVTYLDEWDVLGIVLTNVAGEDKAEQVLGILTDFQSNVDVMAARAVVNIDALLNQEVASGEAAPAQSADPQQVERSETEATMSEHALDGAFAGLREAFDEAIATPVDTQSRLAMIQPAIMELGEAIQTRVHGKDKSVESDGALDANAIAQVVREAIAPLAQKLEVMEAAGKVERNESVIPGPRNLRSRTVPASVRELASEDAGKAPAKPSRLTSIIRKSVGLDQ